MDTISSFPLMIRFVPDFMVVCDREKIKADGVHSAPDLVLEVLSPSTAKNDKGYKKSVYESSGVPEYWIVSPKEKSIEVYLLQDGGMCWTIITPSIPPTNWNSSRTKKKRSL